VSHMSIVPNKLSLPVQHVLPNCIVPSKLFFPSPFPVAFSLHYFYTLASWVEFEEKECAVLALDARAGRAVADFSTVQELKGLEK